MVQEIELNSENLNPWRSEGTLKVSDRQIQDHLLSRMELAAGTQITLENIYDSFLELKKESDNWVKYYFLSFAFWIMVITNAIPEFESLGQKINQAYMLPIAMLGASVTMGAWTFFNTKLSLYEAFFDNQIEALPQDDRARLLLRYPRAFKLKHFIPGTYRPRDILPSSLQVISLLPLAALLGIVSSAIVPTVLLMWIYSIGVLFFEPALPLFVKIGVSIAFLTAITIMSTFTSKPGRKKRYIRSAPLS